jgi:hypothetical protein
VEIYGINKLVQWHLLEVSKTPCCWPWELEGAAKVWFQTHF